MKVTVKLFASLREGRFDVTSLEVREGGTIADAIAAAGLRPGEATVIFKNARHAEPGESLAEGDSLSLFPPVGGG
ncbi:MAG TPA: MoaD/ThiS family protein [Rectinemataceae bacterium]|nr:MoaD/ThiS family protein [Rectinemataceae bacterium]